MCPSDPLGLSYLLPTAVLFCLLFISIFILCFVFWIGTVLAQLWYYKGGLGPDPPIFNIRPEYIKERYRRSLALGNTHAWVHSSGMEGHNHTAALTNPETATDLEILRENWIDTMAVNGPQSNEMSLNENEVEDPVIKEKIAEERRVSRLPAFVRDDCGDGTEFPEIEFAYIPIPTIHDTRAIAAVPDSEAEGMLQQLNNLQLYPNERRTNITN